MTGVPNEGFTVCIILFDGRHIFGLNHLFNHSNINEFHYDLYVMKVFKKLNFCNFYIVLFQIYSATS